MSANAIKVKLRIAELKRELSQLEADLLAVTQPDSPVSAAPTYHDLKGSLKGKLVITEAMLEESRFKLDWGKLLPEDAE
jgi:hypothetical protein